jgi:hypothetical protein
MLLALTFVLGLQQDSGATYSGRLRQLAVPIPRTDTTVVIDGRLDEAVWSRAARLTGFSQYQPVDGQPADDSTEVRVWYGPDAIYFGIRARESHGDVVRATRANRDNIGAEDQVQILLDTYNDRRRAFLFGVNPLGVQQDGTRSDQFGGGAGGRSATGGGSTNMNPLEGSVDLNPDYVFESLGRLVAGGYEVEIRIPFKSLRYQEGAVQTWGINILRRIQHSGFQDSWTPAVRANASFLGQSGSLEGLHDMRRGLVLDVTPTGTQRVDGSAGPSGWDYHNWSQLGADLHWGITQNLSLNGTYQPDFSQVEADVGQVVLNERFALFYPEKRPFFLDGLEQFDTPNQLIYTRQIFDPDAGVKVAGKVGRTNIGALFALDNASQSCCGSQPFFGVARVRNDIGRNSTLGAVLTTREDGSDYSRLVGADARIYHSRLYFVEVQAVQSWTRSAGSDVAGPLFQASWDRTGRNWGFNYSVRAIAPDFQAAAGFVNRTGIIDGEIFNRLTGYGKPGALVQTYGAFVGISRIYDYTLPARGAFEGGESISPSATLRGGWSLGGNMARNFYSFAPADYDSFTVETTLPVLPPGLDTVPFIVPGPERGVFSGSLRATTPTYRMFTLSANVGFGETVIFREAAPGRNLRIGATLDLRPWSALRVAFQMNKQHITRARDGSRFSDEIIPRLKIEYQLTRAIFFRFVGQYTARERDALYDRDGNPILISNVLQTATVTNEFRTDWLFSYRPTPGTLLYLGYGSTMTEPDAFQFHDLQRTADGFFGKVSYLFRL